MVNEGHGEARRVLRDYARMWNRHRFGANARPSHLPVMVTGPRGRCSRSRRSGMPNGAELGHYQDERSGIDTRLTAGGLKHWSQRQWQDGPNYPVSISNAAFARPAAHTRGTQHFTDGEA
jgi:hypothetical protein